MLVALASRNNYYYCYPVAILFVPLSQIHTPSYTKLYRRKTHPLPRNTLLHCPSIISGSQPTCQQLTLPTSQQRKKITTLPRAFVPPQ